MAKKLPVRMCAGCGEHKPKKELVRVVRTPQGELLLDLSGKMAGRGAYVCHNAACLAKARKAKRIERALDCSVDAQVYDRLLREIDGDGGQKGGIGDG